MQTASHEGNAYGASPASVGPGGVWGLVQSVRSYAGSPEDVFWSAQYIRHNQRRQEHLASLRLPIGGRTVLETGAGIGDHTSFFLDRGCDVIVTEGRAANIARLRKRYPKLRVEHLDLNQPPVQGPQVDIVYCYGTLYHLERPAGALKFMAGCCKELLLLETAVSGGTGQNLHPVREYRGSASQAVSGVGCRPTRDWVCARLKEEFPHVYLPQTQPWHEEFPLEWEGLEFDPSKLTRAVFVASRTALDNPVLLESIPDRQIRH